MCDITIVIYLYIILSCVDAINARLEMGPCGAARGLRSANDGLWNNSELSGRKSHGTRTVWQGGDIMKPCGGENVPEYVRRAATA